MVVDSNSKSSRRVEFIAMFRHGNQLVRNFNHEAGKYEDASYTRSLLAESRLFEKFDKTSGFSKKDFNLLMLSSFFQSFFQNIANQFIAIYFYFLIFVIAILGFFRQLIYIKKNLPNYKSKVLDLTYYGQIHLTISAIFAPILFFINLIFIEQIERFLGSFFGLLISNATSTIKIFIQCLEILFLPVLGIIKVIQGIGKIVFKIVGILLAPFFKPVRVSYPAK